MKKIILSIIAVAAICSCQKSDENITEVEAGVTEVVFTSGISTRATGNIWEEGDKIGVYMYEAEASAVYDENCSNVEYSIEDGSEGTEYGTFASANPLYFQQYSDVDFVAYYPYNESLEGGVVSLNTADQSSSEKIEELDFMVATLTDCNENSEDLSLEFSRMMSRIVITVVRKDSRVDAVVSDLSIRNISTEGNYTISNRSTVGVAPISVTSTITLFENEGNQVEAIIVPQTTLSAMLLVVIDGEYVSASLSNTFEAGKQYNYNLVIGIDAVEFTEVSITSWDEQESVDMTSTMN
ncbi:MAG: fimbrillin family protein [Rikenellaceae bacterium]